MIIAIIVLSILLVLAIATAITFGIMWKETYDDKKLLYNKVYEALKESRNTEQG